MISGINHITFSVKCLNISLQFYSDVLGFKPEVRWDKGAYLSSPGIWLCLSLGQAKPSRDYSHLAFSVNEGQFDHLKQQIVAAGYGIWQDNSSEGDSLYFLDPDGHKLEIHCGDLQQRLDSLKHNPYKGLTWYE
ncbi:fosfomycin resistance glutathione transferase [Planctobacterium marinum]|uniref:fosfomycin resistance glutathione transferase n=1 Tax=Planctobacterium marinum TaxID=1631968 RepID=UPI001E3A1AD3|nr:fosfomycin resistance glutathione transferase [Planctobacterium marinum]